MIYDFDRTKIRARRATRAFNVLELLVVVVVMFIFGLLVIPAGTARAKAKRINCVCSLKQVGLAFRIWSSDHNGRYPMQFFTNQAGLQLFADATNGFRYFQVMSNELSTPKILVCPSDTRKTGTNFTSDFTGQNLSYFVGLDADESRPNRFLGGDRNVTNGLTPRNGVMEAQTNQNIGWTKEIHDGVGNLLLADGGVQQVSSWKLRECLTNTGMATNRLLMPQ